MAVKEKETKTSGGYLLRNLLAMVVVMALMVFLTLKGIDIYTNHGTEVSVPDLHGLTAVQAQDRLKSIGLECVVADSGYIKSMPPDAVLEQSVEPGRKVKPGRIINITINSSSSPTIVMPDLADNSSLREAESRLQAVGLVLTPPEYINGEKDWVYQIKCNGKSIGAGTRVSLDSKITIVAGNGLTDEDFSEEDSLDNQDNYGEDINFDDESTGGDGQSE